MDKRGITSWEKNRFKVSMLNGIDFNFFGKLTTINGHDLALPLAVCDRLGNNFV